jgi:hypothetical protein
MKTNIRIFFLFTFILLIPDMVFSQEEMVEALKNQIWQLQKEADSCKIQIANIDIKLKEQELSNALLQRQLSSMNDKKESMLKEIDSLKMVIKKQRNMIVSFEDATNQLKPKIMPGTLKVERSDEYALISFFSEKDSFGRVRLVELDEKLKPIPGTEELIYDPTAGKEHIILAYGLSENSYSFIAELYNNNNRSVVFDATKPVTLPYKKAKEPDKNLKVYSTNLTDKTITINVQTTDSVGLILEYLEEGLPPGIKPSVEYSTVNDEPFFIRMDKDIIVTDPELLTTTPTITLRDLIPDTKYEYTFHVVNKFGVKTLTARGKFKTLKEPPTFPKFLDYGILQIFSPLGVTLLWATPEKYKANVKSNSTISSAQTFVQEISPVKYTDKKNNEDMWIYETMLDYKTLQRGSTPQYYEIELVKTGFDTIHVPIQFAFVSAPDKKMAKEIIKNLKGISEERKKALQSDVDIFNGEIEWEELDKLGIKLLTNVTYAEALKITFESLLKKKEIKK